MQEKNKNIIIFIALTVALTGVLFSVETYLNNVELKKQINSRDSTISKLIASNSLYNSSRKMYSDTITKYIENCEFYIGDKKLSTEELLKLVNEYIDQNTTMKKAATQIYDIDNKKDSLHNLSKSLIRQQVSIYEEQYNLYYDSTFIVSSILNLIKRDYGISYTVTKKGRTVIFQQNRSKADSAIILFPYFKKNLSYDSVAKVWNIKHFEEPIPRRKKKKQ